MLGFLRGGSRDIFDRDPLLDLRIEAIIMVRI